SRRRRAPRRARGGSRHLVRRGRLRARDRLPRLDQRLRPRSARGGSLRGSPRRRLAPGARASLRAFLARRRLLSLHRMTERKASGTARAVAAMRAEYTEKGGPCNDPYARVLAGEDGQALADALVASFAPMSLWLACR